MKLGIGFGANLGDREESLDRAEKLLGERIGTGLARSKVREYEALSRTGRAENLPAYLNAAFIMDSHLPPFRILHELLEIERELGRRREEEKERWAPRLIDLDFLLADDLLIKSSELSLPHPELHRRNFVLEPLIDLFPDWVHPLLKSVPVEMLKSSAARL